MAEEIQRYHGLDFTSIKVLPNPEHLSTCGLSFQALPPPLSLGLGYVLGGWIDGWVTGDRKNVQWQSSYLVHSNLVCHFKILPFLYAHLLALNSGHLEAFAVTVILNIVPHLMQLGSYKCYLTVIFIRYQVLSGSNSKQI